MLGRLRYDVATVTHVDPLRWATEGAARCIGRSDIGKIVVGCEADLALFTLEDLRFSGAGDPIAALVSAERTTPIGSWWAANGGSLTASPSAWISSGFATNMAPLPELL